MTQAEVVRPLHMGWSLRAADPALGAAQNFEPRDGWLSATVPGTVYQDLIAGGRIPDPYFGRNEERVQWVADSDWCYRLDFDVDAREQRTCMALAFDGLDTYAQVTDVPTEFRVDLRNENRGLGDKYPAGVPFT